jgi:cell division protein FtsI (penicillin-binding protein 3)
MNNNLGTSKRLMKRFYLLAAFLFLFALVLVGKLIYIQFYENDKDLGIEPETLVKNVVLEPSRGDIYAADGNILATSISRYELHWDAITPSAYLFETHKKDLADSLAQIYSRPSSTA